MTPFEQHLAILQQKYPGTIAPPIPDGSRLVTVPDYILPAGWSEKKVTILFVAPPGYPTAQPDCFWVEPKGLRLEGGGTPQASNDSNPIPNIGPRGTWFSWHVQQWNPNYDSIVTYFHVIEQRLNPAR
jgi:hypothetical protein